MSRGDSRHERTPEEREHDRLERERRRALRSGRTPPPEAPPSEPAAWPEAGFPEPTPWTAEPEPAPAPPARVDPPPRAPAPEPIELSEPAESIEPVPDPVGADELFAPPAEVARHEPPFVEAAPADQPSAEARAPRRVSGRRKIPGISVPRRHGPVARRSAEGSGPAQAQRRAGPAIRLPAPGSTAPRTPRTRRGRIAALIALTFVLASLWFLFALFQPLKGGGGGSVIVEIPRGASTSGIGDTLVKDGVVSSSFFFNLRATIAGDRGSLKSGRFQLKRDMSYGAALTALTSQQARPLTTRVVVPEGASRVEEAARVKADGLVGNYVSASVHSHLLSPRSYGAPARTHSLEGFLFPATYEVPPHAKASVLVNQQLTTFKKNFAKVNLKAAQGRHLKPYDVLIVASMVEREAQLAKERPLIAAVIYNRLRARMPIGIDATIRYAIGNYKRPLTATDLKLNSAYNTRRRRGLPPTPIGSPGLASIQAAAHPATVKYLYYVVKPGACGEHVFSSNYAQFLKDAAHYASARAAKGGRSPTKC